MSGTDAIRTLVEAIRPILAGHPAPVQSAALADCLAILLAGHEVPGKMHLTHKMRAALLAEHCKLVQQLVPINAKTLGTMS